MTDQHCGNDQPHTFHSHEVAVTRECSGKTPCGRVLHEPHEIEVMASRWCNGICSWCHPFENSNPHGPGAHK